MQNDGDSPGGGAGTADDKISQALESMYNMMVQMVNHRGSPSAQGLRTELGTFVSQLHALSNLRSDDTSPTPQNGSNGNHHNGNSQLNGAAPATAPPSPITTIPKDIVEYVGRGRNPDIYTREFYELAMRTNQSMRGKSEMFAMFRDVLVDDLLQVEPALRAALGDLADPES